MNIQKINRPELHVCPVCNGTGQKTQNFYENGSFSSSAGTCLVTCRSCKGNGYVITTVVVNDYEKKDNRKFIEDCIVEWIGEEQTRGEYVQGGSGIQMIDFSVTLDGSFQFNKLVDKIVSKQAQ